MSEQSISEDLPPPRRTRPDKSRSLERDSWINAAIAALENCTIDALRVDDLAAELGVTKGSFYYHFSSRDDLMNSVLEKWRAGHTQEVEQFVLSSVGTPHGRIKRLIRIAMARRANVPGGPLEIRLRDWAHRDPRVAAIVHEVDACRLAFLRKLYGEAGLPDEQARAMAFRHMAYVIGARVFLDGKSDDEFREGLLLGEEFLLP